jgi:hypothetical protein
LKVYDETIGFAGLVDSDKSQDGDAAPHGGGADGDLAEDMDAQKPPKSFKAGDLVQREANGVLSFPAPRKVTGVFFDKTYGWQVSVDGYSGAYPMSEIIPATASNPLPPVIPATVDAAPGADAAKDAKDPIETFLANGRLQINANVGLEGIGRLKQMLDKYEELLKLMN